MSKLAKALTAAAGNAGGESLYVEDVFSTYLYTGTGATQTITNGIDLDGEGGLVWIKERSDTGQHHLYDTERGATKRIHSNSTAAEATQSDALTAFNSDGFTLGGNSQVNDSGEDTCSWTFRKAEKFFDVVEYTGSNSSGEHRQIAHSLGASPALILIKDLDSVSNWYVYHKDTAQPGDTDYATHGYYLKLNNTDAKAASNTAYPKSGNSAGGVTAAYDSSVFTIGEDLNTNGNGFVAYLFASDAGGFGDDGSESIIKCGSFTTDGIGNVPEIDLGFEPQWIMLKKTSGTGDWRIGDVMRGDAADNNFQALKANDSAAESTLVMSRPTATGYKIDTGFGTNATGIYIAIRRPMKTPESGTEVFMPNDVDNGASSPDSISGFPVDMYFRRYVNTTNDTYLLTRLTSPNALKTNGTDAEAAFSTASAGFDYNNGVMNIFSSDNSDFHTWMFKRATGFFDVVAYTSTTGAVNHNLGVSPELVIYKSRTTGPWYVMTATNGFAELNSSGAWAGVGNGSGLGVNLANATATTITGAGNLYGSGVSMVTYLFATLAGVSKVGSYTGNGSTQTIDCGFSNGARFVLIKGTSLSSNWVVFDSARGITANNDPVLYLNSTTAEFTDTGIDIEPDSSGFILNSGGNVNANNEEYIFLAIA